MFATAAVILVWKSIQYRNSAITLQDKYTKAAAEYSKWYVYQTENKNLIDGQSHPERVVFLGASITQAWDLKQSFPDIEAINRGIDGNRVGGYLLRFKPDVVDLAPQAVVIKICSINFRPYSQIGLDEIKDYIISMIDIAEFHNIKPIPATVVPVRRAGEQYGDYKVTEHLQEYNKWLKTYCQNRNLQVIDYYSDLADSEGYLPDDLSIDYIHPNEKGYEIMTQTADKVLVNIMGNR